MHFAYYISFTTPRPRDACRSALVSPAFRSASSSNAVWEKFLPPDYEDFISQSSSLNLMSKKGLYLHLCHHPSSSVMAPWYAKVNTSYNLSLLLFSFFFFKFNISFYTSRKLGWVGGSQMSSLSNMTSHLFILNYCKITTSLKK